MEEARPRAEVFGRLSSEGGVCAREEGFHGEDLGGELFVGEGAGGFVMHSVVC